ncbi:IS66 family transposase [Deinococcus ruber]|nr:transposase [Deinococcus ruber]
MHLLGGLQITQAAQRLAADGRPLAAHVDALQASIQQAPFVRYDDTGWRIGAQNAWVGAFQSADTVVFRTNPRHTNVEFRDGLGQSFAGVLIGDRFSSYDSRFLQDVRQQKCLAHLIRNMDEVAAGKQRRPGRGELYGQRVTQLRSSSGTASNCIGRVERVCARERSTRRRVSFSPCVWTRC